MVYSPDREARKLAEPPSTGQALLVGDGRRNVLSGSRVVIGRSRECDIVLDDPNVSRRHAELRREDGGWLVVDLGSTNGMKVNGRRVEHAELKPGDRITIGVDRPDLRARVTETWTIRSRSRSSSASSPCSTSSSSGWRAAPCATSRATTTRGAGRRSPPGAEAAAARSAPDLRAGVQPRLEVVAAMGHEPGTHVRHRATAAHALGRSDSADIEVDDPFASSAHARIFPRGDFMYVEDMGSTNGTYLNGRQLKTAPSGSRWPT